MKTFLNYSSIRFNGDVNQILHEYHHLAEEAASSIGATIQGIQFIFDESFHGLPSLDGTKGRHSYTATLKTSRDGATFPVVTFQKIGSESVRFSYRDAVYQDWIQTKHSQTQEMLSPETLEAKRLEAALHLAERKAKAEIQAKQAEEEKNRLLLEASFLAQKIYEKKTVSLIGKEHAYLQKKHITHEEADQVGIRLGVSSYKDVGTEAQLRNIENTLIIPLKNQEGEIVSLQFIQEDGSKKNLKHAIKQGTSLRIGGEGTAWLCEGVATAFSVHTITGQPVLSCLDDNNLKQIASSIDQSLILGIAADNDRSGTGQNTAHALNETLGIPFRLPLFKDPLRKSKDWNDALMEDGLELARKQWFAYESDAPQFKPNELRSLETRQKFKKGELEKAVKEATTPHKAAALAFKWARGLSINAPVLLSIESIMLRVLNAVPTGLIHLNTLYAIQSKLIQMRQKREEKALKAIKILDETLPRHDVVSVKDLSEVLKEGMPQGVVLVRAPMGSGKTQKVGVPFASMAMEQGDGNFLAICHRQTLVAELARRLGTKHYQWLEEGEILGIHSLSTCLPSLTKEAHAPFMNEVKYLFIDEIAQVLRQLASKVRAADNKTMADVLKVLRQLIAEAEVIIGADAGLDDFTVKFIESCRPKGERFKIIQMDTQNLGLEVSFGMAQNYKDLTYVSAVNEAMTKVLCGERVWISVESNEKAQLLEAIIKSAMRGKRIICLHGDNKGNPECEAFFKNPTEESLKYDVVIHTGVISSGISIVHDKPHFTRGYFFGSGSSITPADAVQMLRRVRYLKEWTVMLTKSNSKDGLTEEAIIRGLQESAEREGLSANLSQFDQLKISIEAAETHSKQDFASGLQWVLEHQGFTVHPFLEAKNEIVSSNDVETIKERLGKEWETLLLNAQDIADEQAKKLKYKDRTQEESLLLDRWQIKRDMGVRGVLTQSAIEAYKKGTQAHVERFLALQGKKRPTFENETENLTLRDFHQARIMAYAEIFEGIDILNMRITPIVATLILQRVIKHRMRYAVLGIVPARYGKMISHEIKRGQIVEVEYPMPSDTIKALNDILRLMGFVARRGESKFPSEKTIADLIKAEEAFSRRCGGFPKEKRGASATKSGYIYWYKVRDEELAEIQYWAAQKEQSAGFVKDSSLVGTETSSAKQEKNLDGSLEMEASQYNEVDQMNEEIGYDVFRVPIPLRESLILTNTAMP